jgi:hypothetical protein
MVLPVKDVNLMKNGTLNLIHARQIVPKVNFILGLGQAAKIA